MNDANVFSGIAIKKALAKMRKDTDEMLELSSARNYLNQKIGKPHNPDPIFEDTNTVPCISSKYTEEFNESYPIKFCSSELAWSSIKLNRTENRSIKITNSSSKKIILKMEILGCGFSIQNVESGNYISLDAYESRNLSVIFCPALIGLSLGTLNFTILQENFIKNKKCIRLCGYGGHSRLIFKHIHMAPKGSQFLELGELRDLSESLIKHFSIINKGSLDGFVIIVPKSSKEKYKNIFESVDIEPSKAILPAGEIVNFKLSFHPTRDHINTLFSEISAAMHIANLKLILGDEPNRHRIRNIIEKSDNVESSLLKSKLFKFCCNKINSEKDFKEFENLQESLENAVSLCSSVAIKNISVTLNNPMEHSINHSLTFVEDDETIMYRNISTEDINNALELFVEAWSVKPNFIKINACTSIIFKIKSYLNNVQHFQITSNFMHLFTIIPSEGQLSFKECIDVKLTVPRYGFLPEQEINITINIHNEKIVIPVNVIQQYNLLPTII